MGLGEIVAGVGSVFGGPSGMAIGAGLTLVDMLFGGGKKGQQGGGGGGGGLSAAEIDDMINQSRGMGARQIRGQLAQANVGTAASLASRGLGSSGIVGQGLGQNQASAMTALSDLEAQLAQQRLGLLMAGRGGGGGGMGMQEPSFLNQLGAFGSNLLMYNMQGNQQDGGGYAAGGGGGGGQGDSTWLNNLMQSYEDI